MLLIALAMTTGGSATTNPAFPPAIVQGHGTLQASAADLFRMAEDSVRRGRPDDAQRILNLLARDPSVEVHNEARFRLAILLESSGQEQAAAVLLRQILDEKPSAPAARLKLAALLQKMGDEVSALRELRALQSANLPLAAARFVDRLSASLQANKPFGVQLEVALAPDSNINRATRSDSLGTIFGDFALDKDAKAKSGTGAAIRAFAQARRPLSTNLALVARLGGDANLYRQKAFNDISLDLSAGPQLRLGRTRLGAELGVGTQWYGMKPYQRSAHVTVSGERPIDSVSQLHLYASARWTDNRFNDLQDGRGVGVRLRYERALSPSMLVAASVGVDRFKARDAAYSTRSWNAGVAAYRDIGRMTLSAGVDIGRLNADERLVLLPNARKDRLTRFQLGAVFRQFTISGFAPMGKILFERNRSTVEFYDYKRTRTEFGITRAF